MSPGERPIAIENPFFKLLLAIVILAFFATLGHDGRAGFLGP